MPHDPLDAPVRVVIVDADHRVRDSLADLLGVDGVVAVVGSAGHVAAAYELAASASPDVVVVDPRLPDLDVGLALIGLLAGAETRPRLLALSSPACASDVLDRGADRFLPKGVPPQELIDEIVALARPPDRPSREARADLARARDARLASLRAVAAEQLEQARSLLAGPRLALGLTGAGDGRC